MSSGIQAKFINPIDGKTNYTVLLCKDEDIIVYYAREIFLLGIVFPPIWALLWIKLVMLVYLEWFGSYQGPPAQAHLFHTLNRHSATTIVEARIVEVKSKEEFTLTAAGLQFIVPWAGRALAGLLIEACFVWTYYAFFNGRWSHHGIHTP